jgi:hypothetical protein
MGTIVGRHGGNINKMNNGSAVRRHPGTVYPEPDAPPTPAMLEELAGAGFPLIRLVQL